MPNFRTGLVVDVDLGGPFRTEVEALLCAHQQVQVPKPQMHRVGQGRWFPCAAFKMLEKPPIQRLASTRQCWKDTCELDGLNGSLDGTIYQRIKALNK